MGDKSPAAADHRAVCRPVAAGHHIDGVAVAQAPTLQGKGRGAGVVQLDEFIGVGVAHPVAVGVAGQVDGRVGEDLGDLQLGGGWGLAWRGSAL